MAVGVMNVLDAALNLRRLQAPLKTVTVTGAVAATTVTIAGVEPETDGADATMAKAMTRSRSPWHVPVQIGAEMAAVAEMAKDVAVISHRRMTQDRTLHRSNSQRHVRSSQHAHVKSAKPLGHAANAHNAKMSRIHNQTRSLAHSFFW